MHLWIFRVADVRSLHADGCVSSHPEDGGGLGGEGGGGDGGGSDSGGGDGGGHGAVIVG